MLRHYHLPVTLCVFFFIFSTSSNIRFLITWLVWCEKISIQHHSSTQFFFNQESFFDMDMFPLIKSIFIIPICTLLWSIEVQLLLQEQKSQIWNETNLWIGGAVKNKLDVSFTTREMKGIFLDVFWGVFRFGQPTSHCCNFNGLQMWSDFGHTLVVSPEI